MSTVSVTAYDSGMRRRFRTMGSMLLVAVATTVAFAFLPMSPAFAYTGCTAGSTGIDTTAPTRSTAYQFIQGAAFERYLLGGACYVDDNAASTSEGIDCSGLVAKAWYLRTDYATNWGFRSHYNFRSVNGVWRVDSLTNVRPVISTQYLYVDSTWSWSSIPISSATLMDAFVYQKEQSSPGDAWGHTGLIVDNSSLGVSVHTFEARSSAYGVGEFFGRNLLTPVGIKPGTSTKFLRRNAWAP